MDVSTQNRILVFRDEIAALRKDNAFYARQPFHAPSAVHTHDLRRIRLEAIKDELLRLNKREM